MAARIPVEEVQAAATAQAKDEASAAATTGAASAAMRLTAAAAAQDRNVKMSTERTHETGEAAVATMTTKIERDMLGSQNNIQDQIEEKYDETKALIEERRNMRKEDKEQKTCEQEDQNEHQIRTEFKRVKNISSINSARKRILIPNIKNGRDEVITSRRRIVHVFGEFHSKLCADDQCDEVEHDFDKSDTRTNVGAKAMRRKKREKFQSSQKRGAGCHRQPQKRKSK